MEKIPVSTNRSQPLQLKRFQVESDGRQGRPEWTRRNQYETATSLFKLCTHMGTSYYSPVPEGGETPTSGTRTKLNSQQQQQQLPPPPPPPDDWGAVLVALAGGPGPKLEMNSGVVNSQLWKKGRVEPACCFLGGRGSCDLRISVPWKPEGLVGGSGLRREGTKTHRPRHRLPKLHGTMRTAGPRGRKSRSVGTRVPSRS